MKRCDWAKSKILQEYHDDEWGKFTLDDYVHFEHICLSGFQAGLNWEMILSKREALEKINNEGCQIGGDACAEIAKAALKEG
jgi:3-methyladenine DNA glycosylase Tag